VARGRGRAPRRFVCPYHGWTYDLAGRLIARRHAEAFEGADGEGCSLAALPVAEAFGLVYVRPTPGEPVDVARLLGGLERELGPYGFEHWHHVETRVLERAMNWKLVVDTFLEAYHVPALHGESLAPKMHGSLAVADRFGRNGRMLAARRSLEQLDGRPESEWTVVPHATIIYCLFPNTVLIGQQDHVELWQVFPHDDSPDHAAMVITLYAPEAVTSEKAARHWQANMDLLVRVTNEEDFVLCEQAQRGFHTGAQASIVFGRNEMLLAHYHRAIREAISEEA
jgi:phenylpropionate dioxygenase-like ring-hydroxylating dioxygenase large terminal subunit